MFESEHSSKQKRKIIRLPDAKKGRIVGILAIALIFAASALALSSGLVTSANAPGPVFDSLLAVSDFGSLILSPDKKMRGEDVGKINLLVLGVGGNGYYGEIVTDTILLISVGSKPSSQTSGHVSLLSLPRDLALAVPGQDDLRRINEVYKFGELEKQGRGIEKITQTIKELTGEEVYYFVVFDLEGFKRAIDALGGIEVEVEKSFIDRSYPNYELGYFPSIVFQAGRQWLDGERALQFARSRHGTNGEGSDFARIRRQHKVVTAFQKRIEELNFIEEIAALPQFLVISKEHVRTNLALWEIKRLYTLTKGIGPDSIHTASLDPTTGLVCRKNDSAVLYLLHFCPGVEPDEVKEFVQSKLR
ncbi:MAG: LCP family protein [Candidatus Doudnabacteria bacterium]|nr:LCP family protein [Candidatus Doudnabacteria bacterium]